MLWWTTRQLKNAPDRNTRLRALQKVATSGSRHTARVLAEALTHRADDSIDTEAILDAMIRLGEQATGPLIAVLNEHKGPRSFRAHVLSALGKIGDLRAVDPIIEFLQNAPVFYRVDAIRALGTLRDARAVPILTQTFKNKSCYFRRETIKALGAIGGSRALSVVAEGINDPSTEVRAAAIEALESFGPLTPDLLCQIQRVRSELEVTNSLRWRQSEDARSWVKAHNGNWNRDECVQLLENLKRSDFWPMTLEGLHAALEEVRENYVRKVVALWVGQLTRKIEIEYEGDSYLPTRSTEVSERWYLIKLWGEELVRIGPPVVPHLSRVSSNSDSFVSEAEASFVREKVAGVLTEIERVAAQARRESENASHE